MENDLFRRLFGRAAPGSARRDDPRMAATGLMDDGPDGEPDMDADDSDYMADPRNAPIGPLGIGDDEVAMPGGGSARIDDIMARGEMTPDLMRKARPEVWRAEETRAPGETSYGSEAADEERLRRYRANEGGSSWHETRGGR